jgi:RNA 2',3'-cyclic 3'-phosphodiesterase
MRLHAALIPPLSARNDLAEVVRSVPGHGDQLDPVPAHRLHLWVANFGNVALSDALDLQHTLAAEFASWQPLRLRFHGATALDREGDDAVWASLDGDVEQVLELGRMIPRTVKRLGFLIDRRTFRPQVCVGRITSATTLEYLQGLLDRLEAYAGQPWECREVTLLRPSTAEPAAEDPDVEVAHRLPFTGGHAAAGDAGRH